MKKISIVTVVYNCESTIQATVESVLSQTYIDEIEYIIIDGNSNDNTLAIINKFRDKIDVVVSEADTGIYNAMNKSLNYISGEWVLFLNSGDVFENIDSVKNAFLHENEFGCCDIVGFNTIFKVNNKFKVEKVKDLSQRWICVAACHQSLLIKSAIHKKYKYDEKYKICADHELFNRLISSDFKFKGIDSILSVFAFDGVSATNRIQLYKEKLMIARRMNAPVTDIIKLKYLIARLHMTGFIKKHLINR